MKSSRNLSIILSILFIILVAIMTSINQKENTKLRILIWETPKTSIGNYIGISSLSGFIISSIGLYYLSKLGKKQTSKTVRRTIKNNQSSGYEAQTKDPLGSVDNILFERDLREPPPTMNVPFRVVGRVSESKKAVNNEVMMKEDTEFDSNQKDYSPPRREPDGWDDIETDTW